MYDWHKDMIEGSTRGDDMLFTRKLSMVLLLNDPSEFEGGQFQINTGSEKRATEVVMKKGRLVAFPSWVIHRVLPVTSGIRQSLVVWGVGPKFK